MPATADKVRVDRARCRVRPGTKSPAVRGLYDFLRTA